MTIRSFGVRCLLTVAVCSASCGSTSYGAKVLASSQTTSDCKSTVVGEIEKRTFESTTFSDTQTLRIWLPPGYRDPANAQRHYPVLYMLDGENLFDVCTAGSHHEWQIDETLTKLIGDGSVEPLIVVGIDSPGKRRGDEYIPYADPIFPAPEPHGRQFPAFLETEVLPLISGEFRVSKGPEHTAIGGSSYGAVAALYALVRRPDLFGLGLLESTSLQVGNGQMLRDVVPLALGPRRVYVGVGTHEIGDNEKFARDRGMEPSSFDRGFVELSERLSAAFEASALNHPAVLLVETPEARHEEQAWAGRFPAAIQFLFPKPSTESPKEKNP
jgi:predicted alpha/beta superfamily hydrolase